MVVHQQKFIEVAKLFASLTLLVHTTVVAIELQMEKRIIPTPFHHHIYNSNNSVPLLLKILAHFSYETEKNGKIVFETASILSSLLKPLWIAAIPSIFFSTILVQLTSTPTLISAAQHNIRTAEKNSPTTTISSQTLSSTVRSSSKLITRSQWKFIIIASWWSFHLFVHLNRRIKFICHILLTMYINDLVVYDWNLALFGLVSIWLKFNLIRILRKIIKITKHI